jgi:hypothetical protein
MSALASPQLDLTEQPDGGARYRLPRQSDLLPRLGRAAGLGLVILLPLLVPLFFVPLGYLVLVLSAGGVVLLTAAGVGVWLMVAEVYRSARPAEVLVSKDGLSVRGGVGPFRWKHRRPLLQVHFLTLGGDGPKEARLQAFCFRDAPLLLARSLPRDLLEPLAHDLAARVAGLDPTRDEAPEVRDEHPLAPAAERQPLRSRIIVAERGGGVVFTVPPLGFRGPVLVLLAGGVACLLCGVGTLYDTLARGGLVTVRGGLSFVFNMLIQWPFAVLWVVWGLHRAVRRVILSVHDGVLRLEEHKLLGDTSCQWSRDELRTILASPMGLVIVPHKGAAVAVNDLDRSNAQSREEELRWLAAALRQALGLAGDGREQKS